VIRFPWTAITIIATSVVTVLPAQAQDCTTHYCPPAANGDTYECSDALGHLRRVFPEQIAGVDDSYRVWVTEVCPEEAMMRSDGNATYLLPAIAANDVLVEALRRQGHVVDDVVAVRMMGEETISLYVHRFRR